MDYKIQLLSFLVSFIYGIVFYFASLLNYQLIKGFKIWFKYIITFVYMIVISFLYLLILFKVNKGNVHIYFIIMTFIGFITAHKLLTLVKNNVKFSEIIAKLKRKWYNQVIIRVILWIEGCLKKIKED